MAWTSPPPTDADRAEIARRAGLCGVCRHLRVLRSRTSTFVRCDLAGSRPEMPRYPVLPVRECPGYERATETPPTGAGSRGSSR